MLLAFSTIFVRDTNIIFVNNFVAPLTFANFGGGELKIFRKSTLEMDVSSASTLSS